MSNDPVSDGFLRSPINPKDSKIGRVDQGVDITSASPFIAVAGGTVVHIDPNFYNGTPAVYIKLDHPVKVNGRTYSAVYYSETASLVRVGQHVSAGQPITGPGSAELGFARHFGVGWLPAAHGSYREGNATQPGNDFLGALQAAVFTGSGEKTPGVTKTIVDTTTGETTTTSGPGTGFLNVLNELLSAEFWLRALEVVGGGILLLLGLYLLARNVGLAASPPGPLRRGAELSDSAAAEMQFSPGRAAAPKRRPGRSVDVSEAGERRAALRQRASRANPSNDIPF